MRVDISETTCPTCRRLAAALEQMMRLCIRRGNCRPTCPVCTVARAALEEARAAQQEAADGEGERG